MSDDADGKGKGDPPKKEDNVVSIDKFAKRTKRKKASPAQKPARGKPTTIQEIFDLHHELLSAMSAVNDALSDIVQLQDGFIAKLNLPSEVRKEYSKALAPLEDAHNKCLAELYALFDSIR